MPMPHRTFAQVARRRLQGREGSERVRTINALLTELPDYRNGPYADLRKWLQQELDRTRTRATRDPSRLAAGATGGSGADRARRPPERRQVVAPAGALDDSDQDRRLRVHDAASDPRADADRRGARAVGRDPGTDRGRERRPRRRPCATRCAAELRCDRLLPGARRAGRRARVRAGGSRGARGSRSPRSSPRRSPTRPSRAPSSGCATRRRGWSWSRSAFSTTTASTACGRRSGRSPG